MLLLVILQNSHTTEGYSQVYMSGGSTTIAFGARAAYDFKKYSGARGSLEYIVQSSVISFKVPLQMLYYPLGYSKLFNLYAAGGLAHYLNFGNNTKTSSFGIDIYQG